MTTKTWEHETEQSWRGLAERLEQWLTAVPPDGRVVIELAWSRNDATEDWAGDPPYIQFTIDDGGTVSAEAASNDYLEPRFQLDTGRLADLGTLGWEQRPGTCGFYTISGQLPGQAQELSARLVVTLPPIRAAGKAKAIRSSATAQSVHMQRMLRPPARGGSR